MDDFTATEDGYGSLVWILEEADYGGDDEVNIRYKIQYEETTDTWTTLAEDLTEKEYTFDDTVITDDIMGTTITIRVTASNTDGDGEPSDEIEVSFVEKPDTPTDFEEDTSALTDDSFTVTWVESANSDKTGEITYTITDDAGVEVTTTETSYVTEAADQGQDYTYTLTAKNVNDFESDATDEITIKFVGQPG